MVADYKQIGPM